MYKDILGRILDLMIQRERRENGSKPHKYQAHFHSWQCLALVNRRHRTQYYLIQANDWRVLASFQIGGTRINHPGCTSADHYVTQIRPGNLIKLFANITDTCLTINCVCTRRCTPVFVIFLNMQHVCTYITLYLFFSYLPPTDNHHFTSTRNWNCQYCCSLLTISVPLHFTSNWNVQCALALKYKD